MDGSELKERILLIYKIKLLVGKKKTNTGNTFLNWCFIMETGLFSSSLVFVIVQFGLEIYICEEWQ